MGQCFLTHSIEEAKLYYFVVGSKAAVGPQAVVEFLFEDFVASVEELEIEVVVVELLVKESVAAKFVVVVVVEFEPYLAVAADGLLAEDFVERFAAEEPEVVDTQFAEAVGNAEEFVAAVVLEAVTFLPAYY